MASNRFKFESSRLMPAMGTLKWISFGPHHSSKNDLDTSPIRYSNNLKCFETHGYAFRVPLYCPFQGQTSQLAVRCTSSQARGMRTLRLRKAVYIGFEFWRSSIIRTNYCYSLPKAASRQRFNLCSAADISSLAAVAGRSCCALEDDRIC